MANNNKTVILVSKEDHMLLDLYKVAKRFEGKEMTMAECFHEILEFAKQNESFMKIINFSETLTNKNIEPGENLEEA